jgi:formyl-CoA transferase
LIVGVANDRLFAKLARVLNRPAWAEDERFRTSAGRLAHKSYLLEEIRAIFRTDTKERWMERLEAASIPCAPILTIPEVLAQPQTQALNIFREQPGLEVALMQLPMSFDGMRATFQEPAPQVGEHTEEVLRK